jgi:glutamine amidotransferase
MIAIIDYGMGNLRSVQKAFESEGHDARVTRSLQVINDASHVVLPGVGAFGDCMANLDQYGLVEPIRRVIRSGRPFLGICLGLQLLFTESEEFGLHQGIGIVPGKVKRFPFGQAGRSGGSTAATGQTAGLKVPHMGWNAIQIKRQAPPLAGIETGTLLYFVHSYYAKPDDPSVVCTETDYGVSFPSSIWRDNVFACQFHPEKSQTVGLRLIRNFGQWE